MYEYNSKAYRELDWLYRFICKETLTKPKEGLTKYQLEYEINVLLIKWGCVPF